MVSTPDRKMIIGTFLNGTGAHVACWRLPEMELHAPTEFEHYAEMARIAEAARLQFLFFADSLAIHYGSNLDLTCRLALLSHLEPLTLLSTLSVVTEHIGLIGSATTTYNEPIHIARKFASLDHLSKGRAGWNLITSQNQAEAFNFGRDAHVVHAERYERASEMADVVFGLWDSWEDDAFVGDKEQGLYYDPKKLHFLNHKGKHFSVKGPLNVPRPVQGYPVISQAGSSDIGMDLGARTADLVFTAQQNFEGAKKFYDEAKGRLAKFGRKPEDMKIVVGVQPIVGRTDEEAEEKYKQLEALVHPEVGRLLLSQLLGNVDLSGYSLDEPLPELPESNAGKSRLALLAGIAKDEKLTLGQLGQRAAGARGHWTVRGSAKKIADTLQEWYEGGACDGYILIAANLPGSLRDFCELVVPELQKRGLFHTEYEGKTLRENLGVPRPANQFANPTE